MTDVLMPLIRQKFFTPGTNTPLAGGKVYTYAAGTNIPLATYTDSINHVANTNPVILDANGEANIYFAGGLGYKINVLDASNTQVPGYPIDNLGGQATSGSYTGTVTGGTTAPTITVKWYRVGDLVTITLPTLGALGYIVSNANTFTVTGGPAASIGTSATNKQTATFTVLDNDIFLDTGGAYVDAAGTIVFTNLHGSATWTNSGRKSYGTPTIGIAAGGGITFSYVVY